MKQSLEDLKGRTPRIPLPELTEEEKANRGQRGAGYEARLRLYYLPRGEGQGGGHERSRVVTGERRGVSPTWFRTLANQKSHLPFYRPVASIDGGGGLC